MLDFLLHIRHFFQLILSYSEQLLFDYHNYVTTFFISSINNITSSSLRLYVKYTSIISLFFPSAITWNELLHNYIIIKLIFKCSVLNLLRNTKRVKVNGVYSYCVGDGQQLYDNMYYNIMAHIYNGSTL